MSSEIKNIGSPSPDLLNQLEKEIRSYNNLHLPEMTIENIALSIHKNNVLIGGLSARIPWDWLHIVLLWVTEEERRSGIGKSLIEKAENEAIKRCCKHAMVETFTAESKDFFIKQGYKIYGELPDFPIGFKRYYLKKQLS